MEQPVKIGVVGDGPIGNIIIAKLLIEQWRNKDYNEKTIEIIHHRSDRVASDGYSRRHILFITEELVNELEANVLNCQDCLRVHSNKQTLSEESENGKKLLFSTRILEEILLKLIDDTNKNEMCNETTRCLFRINNKQPEKAKVKSYYSSLGYDYIFFAIGSNAGNIRNPYFYLGDSAYEGNTVKILCDETDPIVAFYSKLGTVTVSGKGHQLYSEDYDSKIYLISKAELKSIYNIDIFELEPFAIIIYTFFDKFNKFVKTLENRYELEKTYTNYNDYTLANTYCDKDYINKCNLSLNGYENYAVFVNKFSQSISVIKSIFKNNEFLLKEYKNFIKTEEVRTHPDNKAFNDMYEKIINNDTSILGPDGLFENYKKLILAYLIKDNGGINVKKCIDEEDGSYVCDTQEFLVNVVGQSLNSYGIYDDKLVYAKKDAKTKYFLVGDMANAYSPGISVEIGINFVNYIIPMFYNFYINEIKTILTCNQLNIVDILDDLLTPKYDTLLNKNIDTKNYFILGDGTKPNTLRKLIENIKNNYKTVPGLCDDNDIFLTYYNIVSLVQYIKNVDLIINNKKIIGISKIFKPRNYKILTYANNYNELEQFEIK